jgi:hypothetical protein
LLGGFHLAEFERLQKLLEQDFARGHRRTRLTRSRRARRGQAWFASPRTAPDGSRTRSRCFRGRSDWPRRPLPMPGHGRCRLAHGVRLSSIGSSSILATATTTAAASFAWYVVAAAHVQSLPTVTTRSLM